MKSLLSLAEILIFLGAVGCFVYWSYQYLSFADAWKAQRKSEGSAIRPLIEPTGFNLFDSSLSEECKYHRKRCGAVGAIFLALICLQAGLIFVYRLLNLA